jgi:alpha-galactosidase/6-phospho-beta-glucosidase family protein
VLDLGVPPGLAAELEAVPTRITATLDAREAMDGADYVVNMFDTGGAAAYEHDYLIPLKYGVDQCIGDTLGPGGVFRALRTIPTIVQYAKEMEQVSPRGLLLNYVNPMAAVCYALGQEAKVQFVGLCHGVQTTIDLIAHVLGEKKENLDYLAAGINHMAWFLKLEKDGVDLYPKFRERCERPEVYKIEKVRVETMRHFGYFMTESTGHLSWRAAELRHDPARRAARLGDEAGPEPGRAALADHGPRVPHRLHADDRRPARDRSLSRLDRPLSPSQGAAGQGHRAGQRRPGGVVADPRAGAEDRPRHDH